MSINATTSALGLNPLQQGRAPCRTGLRRIAVNRARAASSRQDAHIKPVDVTRPLQATISLAAGVLLSAQVAYAAPQPLPVVSQTTSEAAVIHTSSPVADLALDSLGEAVRGTNEEATKQAKENLPPSAPAATEGAARAAATLKASASDALSEPTPGGKKGTSPVSMDLSGSPRAQCLAMQLAEVSDEANRNTIVDDAKFPVKLDTGAGFKRNDSEEKAYSKDLVNKAKNSLPDKLSPGSSDLGAKGPLDPETPSPGVRQ